MWPVETDWNLHFVDGLRERSHLELITDVVDFLVVDLRIQIDSVCVVLLVWAFLDLDT